MVRIRFVKISPDLPQHGTVVYWNGLGWSVSCTYIYLSCAYQLVSDYGVVGLLLLPEGMRSHHLFPIHVVSCVQTWYYFDNYKNDPTFLRVVVSINCLALLGPSRLNFPQVFCTWLSDTIHQILISQAGKLSYPRAVWSLIYSPLTVYNYTITHFGDTDNLQNVLWCVSSLSPFVLFTFIVLQESLCPSICQLTKGQG